MATKTSELRIRVSPEEKAAIDKTFVIVEEYEAGPHNEGTTSVPRWATSDREAAERRLAELNKIYAIGLPVPGVYTAHSTYYAACGERIAAYAALVGELDPPIDGDANWSIHEVQEL